MPNPPWRSKARRAPRSLANQEQLVRERDQDRLRLGLPGTRLTALML